MKLYTTTKELCQGCPQEFRQYMDYTKNLQFEEKPNYAYMLKLFTDLAAREGIDLTDNMYDWSVRAVTLKSHSNFFDFVKSQDVHPFQNDGRFAKKWVEQLGEYEPEVEAQIYSEAKKFKFEEPKQLIKLMRKEEMKRLKSR
jgi:ketol-acid reductoisomerase